MSSRFAILEASERFSPEQKSRPIIPQDIFLATFTFGYPLTGQLKVDYQAGFKAWALWRLEIT